jgi:hypothetical protein
MPSNRDLLIAQRKREKGLPAVETAIAPRKDTSRRTGRAFTTTGGTGFQGIPRRSGAAELKRHPGVTEGIKEPGDVLAREFAKKGSLQAGLRPQAKAQDGQVADPATTGIPSNVTILKSQKQRLAAPQSQSFGLPTDRMPSFAELGGAIGQLFKHVGGIARQRRAAGLIPGRRATTTDTSKGLKGKDLANILLKQLEAANLQGDEEKAAAINAKLEAIINSEEASDLTAIKDD